MSTMTEYRQQLARFVLSKSDGVALTASAIAEQMAIDSMHMGHPKECWKDITAQAVAAMMRTMTDGKAVCNGAQHFDTRAGRHVPTWQKVASAQAVGFPQIPTDHEFADEAEPETPKDEYEKMSRAQLLAVVRVSDRGFGLLRQFLRDLENYRDDACKQLRSVGLDPDT